MAGEVNGNGLIGMGLKSQAEVLMALEMPYASAILGVEPAVQVQFPGSAQADLAGMTRASRSNLKS